VPSSTPNEKKLPVLNLFIPDNALTDLYAVIKGHEDGAVDTQHVVQALWMLNKVINMQNKTYSQVIAPVKDNTLVLFKRLNQFLTVHGMRDPEICLGTLRFLLGLMLKCDAEAE
jgi:hypothetical protein